MKKENTGKKDGRGGQRQGAGRKPEIENKQRKTVDISEDMEREIVALGYDVSPFLREAGEIRIKHLKGMIERDKRRKEKAA